MIRDVRRAKASIGHVTYDEKEEKGLPGRRSLYAVKDIARGEGLSPMRTFGASGLPTGGAQAPGRAARPRGAARR